jgi:hypothetical protein
MNLGWQLIDKNFVVGLIRHQIEPVRVCESLVHLLLRLTGSLAIQIGCS